MVSAKESKIERLERQLRQEREKQRRREIKERAAATKRARALETRRKILVGGMILNRIERGQIRITAADLLAMLSNDLTRPHDRAAFDLPPLQSVPEQPPDYLPETSANGY
jgi:hypothetical protein